MQLRKTGDYLFFAGALRRKQPPDPGAHVVQGEVNLSGCAEEDRPFRDIPENHG